MHASNHVILSRCCFILNLSCKTNIRRSCNLKGILCGLCVKYLEIITIPASGLVCWRQWQWTDESQPGLQHWDRQVGPHRGRQLRAPAVRDGGCARGVRQGQQLPRLDIGHCARLLEEVSEICGKMNGNFPSPFSHEWKIFNLFFFFLRFQTILK